MKTSKHHAWLLAYACVGLACSGEPEPAPTDMGEYVAPTLGERGFEPIDPSYDMRTPPALDLDLGSGAEVDAGAAPTGADMDTCCALVFALPDDNGVEDELYVQLVGSGAPLSPGLTLAYEDGAWSVEACVPPGFRGTYSYVVGRDVDGETAEEVTYNPFAPTEDNMENVWVTSESCEGASLESHALTSAP